MAKPTFCCRVASALSPICSAITAFFQHDRCTSRICIILIFFCTILSIPNESAGKYYISTDMGISLEFPDDWIEVESERILSIRSSSRDGVWCYIELKEITDFRGYGDQNRLVTDFFDEAFWESWLSKVEVTERIDSGYFQQNGKTFSFTNFASIFQGVEIVDKTIITIQNSKAVWITCACKREIWLQQRDSIDKVLGSFTIIE